MIVNYIGRMLSVYVKWVNQKYARQMLVRPKGWRHSKLRKDQY